VNVTSGLTLSIALRAMSRPGMLVGAVALLRPYELRLRAPREAFVSKDSSWYRCT
jgi:hypothetical protein